MSLKVTGNLDIEAPSRLLVATDGAVRVPPEGGRAAMGLGYVASSGRWGLLSIKSRDEAVYDDPVLVAELRAAALGCRQALNSATETPPAAGRDVVLLSDSQAALGFITAWKRGREHLPAGYPARSYSGKPTLLATFAHQLATGDLTVEAHWQPGHTGHELNELADSLAKLALRTRGSDKAASASTAESWVERRREAIIAAGRHPAP